MSAQIQALSSQQRRLISNPNQLDKANSADETITRVQEVIQEAGALTSVAGKMPSKASIKACLLSKLSPRTKAADAIAKSLKISSEGTMDKPKRLTYEAEEELASSMVIRPMALETKAIHYHSLEALIEKYRYDFEKCAKHIGKKRVIKLPFFLQVL